MVLKRAHTKKGKEERNCSENDDAQIVNSVNKKTVLHTFLKCVLNKLHSKGYGCCLIAMQSVAGYIYIFKKSGLNSLAYWCDG